MFVQRGANALNHFRTNSRKEYLAGSFLLTQGTGPCHRVRGLSRLIVTYFWAAQMILVWQVLLYLVRKRSRFFPGQLLQIPPCCDHLCMANRLPNAEWFILGLNRPCDPRVCAKDCLLLITVTTAGPLLQHLPRSLHALYQDCTIHIVFSVLRRMVRDALSQIGRGIFRRAA